MILWLYKEKAIILYSTAFDFLFPLVIIFNSPGHLITINRSFRMRKWRGKINQTTSQENLLDLRVCVARWKEGIGCPAPV